MLHLITDPIDSDSIRVYARTTMTVMGIQEIREHLICTIHADFVSDLFGAEAAESLDEFNGDLFVDPNAEIL